MSSRSQTTAGRPRAVMASGAAALLAAAWSLAAFATGAHAEEAAERVAATCNGFTPTEVGAAGATMVGTAGDDVFITRGATRVDTGAGNDSICVTGRGPVVINAGPGNDFVGARKHIGKSFVSLGFGDDLFFGGTGDDRVWSQEASNQNSTDDRDQIYTGQGGDYVISGSSSAHNSDRVNLGPGNDVLVTYGFSGSANLVGGLGHNTYQPLPGPGASGEWTFDNVTGQATLDGDHAAGVDLVPAVRPPGALRLQGPLPRQSRQRARVCGRHVPGSPAWPGRERPPDRGVRRVQQPAGRRRAADRRTRRRPAVRRVRRRRAARWQGPRPRRRRSRHRPLLCGDQDLLLIAARVGFRQTNGR